jgi:FOG: WD40-like repeat
MKNKNTLILFITVYFAVQTASKASTNDSLFFWKFTSGPIFTRPVIANNVAYFGSKDKNFYAVNIKTGKELWHFKADTVNSFAAVKDNIVVFESKNRLYGLDASNGKQLWSFGNNDNLNVSVGFTDYHHSSPIIENNLVIFCDQNGIIHSIDLITGKQLYKFQLDSKQPIRATPVFRNGIVYVGDWGGNIYAVSIKKESLLWKHKMDSVREYYGAVVSEMVLKDDLLFFGSQHDVSCPLDIRTGKPVWSYFNKEHTYLPSTPVFRGTKMFIATTIFANKIYCFDYKKGSKPEWEYQAEGIFFTTPVLQDSVLIINSSLYFDQKTSNLYFINCNNGKLIGMLPFKNMGPSLPAHKHDTLYLSTNDGLYAGNYNALLELAKSKSDSINILATSKNYIEGWYNGDTARMNKALNQDLVKRRFDYKQGILTNLTKANMMEFTRAGYGKKTPREKLKNDFQILDTYQNMASVKVSSCDFVDYMQLLKVDGEWKIINVLWDFK